MGTTPANQQRPRKDGSRDDERQQQKLGKATFSDRRAETCMWRWRSAIPRAAMMWLLSRAWQNESMSQPSPQRCRPMLKSTLTNCRPGAGRQSKWARAITRRFALHPPHFIPWATPL